MNNPKPFQKRIAIVLLVIFLPSLLPINMLYASNNGPKSPEASSFEPVDSTDMVNLATGDMNYVMPLLNVPSPEGGYPLVLSYHGGIAYDLESSWVGLGWNLNPGAIERGVNGHPDDWKEALIRTRNFYEFNATTIDVGVSVGLKEGASIDIGVSYGWDSNGGRYGTVNLGGGIGVGDGNKLGGGYSVGYHNQNGMIFNVSAGYQDKSGAGVGGSVGTSGAGIGATYTLSTKDAKIGKSNATISQTIGISLSTNGIGGTYSLSAGQGDSTFSINSGSLGELTETNMSIAIPLVVVPAWIKFGKRKIKFEKNETYANFVNGPLYYKDFNYQQGSGPSYSNALDNESNRDYFMDSYEQALPQSESEFVNYEDIYESQKYAFTFPSYDSYVVNAQGLAGAMTPRLFENGTIVGKSQNFEQKDDNIVIPGSFPVAKGGGVISTPPAPLNYNLDPPVAGYNGGILHFGVLPTTYEYRSLESFVMNWNYSSSSRKFTKSFGTSFDQNVSNQMRFYFENSFPTNLAITPSNLNASSSLIGFIGNTNSNISNRQQNSNYVEAFTNKQLAKRASNPLQLITSSAEAYAQTGVLVPFNGDQNYNRIADNGYTDEGIGAYKITTPDGKTYHYAMPVYQFEEVYRQLKKKPSNCGDCGDSFNNGNFFNENRFYQEQRKNQPYATHWLLTAVTGPDYYDANGNGYADSSDYGYWTRFDYGKWTDGYCWRTPFNGFNDFDQFANYNQNENAREYGWGRKQLAYLNKVVTRTHTAIMVKSLRNDSMSKEIGNEVISVNPINGQPTYGYPSFEGDNSVYYPSQRTMKLDEIILVQNENDNVLASNQVQAITANPSQARTVNWHSPIVKNYSTSTNFVQYKINQQNLVIDNGDLPKDANGNYLIYQKAEKIIKLNQDYSLATNSPHSDAPAAGGVASKGRLTLKSIQNLGRNAYDYMPPTTFEYFNNNLAYQECPNATCNIKNPWGYHNNVPQAWSLQKITTPTGAKLEFELEKDTYWTEAFSRRYWLEDLMFKGTVVGNDLIIEVKKKTGSSVDIDFTEYFLTNEQVFLDLLIWKRNRWWSGTDKREGKWKLDLTADKYCEVINVTTNSLTIKSPNNASLIEAQIGCVEGNNNCFFARGNPIIGSHVFEDQNPREYGQPATPSPGFGNDASHHRMYYNLLANRVPGEGTGGGLRVKSITSVDEVSNRYTTEYTYNHPTKNRTSGITSFAPVRGLKYVPYQADLPAPRVMYEYVTVTEKTNNNGLTQKNGKTVYRFNVLENATNIFDKNITVGDYFKSEVTTNDNLNSNLKVKGAQIKLHDNTSQLGSVISIERFNNANQLLSKTLTKRKSLNDLIASTTNSTSKGAVQESFQSMKSIHQFNSNYVKAQAGLSAVFVNYTTTQKAFVNSSLTTHNRLLNVSTKTVYTPYTDYTEEFDGTGKTIKTWQEDQDPVNGLFNTSITTNTKGQLVKSQIIPAYSVKKPDGTLAYSSMGSKVSNINNKNMLTQEAMTISSINTSGNTWKTTGASITTWNDTWAYRNESTGTDVAETQRKVWRKHKTFAWKESLDSDGSYLTNISSTNTQFNFGLGTPLNNKWQKLSEVTRYTRWSSAIEAKDMNGNFASSKMGDNDTKVLVSGNARYSEMYYAGAENVKSGNLFDGEVKGANFRSAELAHTGKYSVKAYTVNDKVFEVTGNSGSANYYTSSAAYPQSFRPGKYKVSFWAYKSYYLNSGGNQTMALPAPSNQNHGQLFFNGSEVPVSETIGAGCWQQLNFYIDILPNTANSIVVRSRQITGNDFFDDFRMHPIASSIASYVYDEDTDDLSYILDGNNMAAAFKYDRAGRLMANYTEIMDTPQLTGGFKINSQYKQSYKNQVLPSDAALGSTINNCGISQQQLLSASLKSDCIGALQSQFSTQVSGGSGNYKFEYKWLTDEQGNEFTSYTVGSASQLVPYVAKFCNGEQFDKVWTLAVKVTDNVTGQIAEDQYTYETAGCNFSLTRNWASISLSNCWKLCIPKKTLILHHLNAGTRDDLRYEISYFNKNRNSFDSWIDLTADAGVFCPQEMQVVDESSPSGYRDFVYVAFRIVNRTTGETSPFNTMTLYGDALLSGEPTTDLFSAFPDDRNYVRPGMAIYKDADGRIINVVDTERPIN